MELVVEATPKAEKSRHQAEVTRDIYRIETVEIQDQEAFQSDLVGE